MAGETVITVVGNLVDDPELRFTPSGAAVAKFRVASTPRTFDRQTNEWKDGESLFLTCSVWRQAAENVAESLQRGMRVIVSGSGSPVSVLVSTTASGLTIVPSTGTTSPVRTRTTSPACTRSTGTSRR